MPRWASFRIFLLWRAVTFQARGSEAANSMIDVSRSGERASSATAIDATSTFTSSVSGRYISVSVRSARSTGSSPASLALSIIRSRK